MRYVLTNAQMRAADGFTINELKVPSLTLMERAGAALAAEAERMCPAGGDVLCVCGGGNNGGDGFVCARLLLRKGISVAVLCTAEKFSAECKRNKEEFEKAAAGRCIRSFRAAAFLSSWTACSERAFRASFAVKTPSRPIISTLRARKCCPRIFLRAYRETAVSPRKKP